MADNNLQASFKKLMRYAQNLAEYEQGIAEGIIDENVFVIVLEEKVAKFKGQTFDWSPLDISSLATKAEVIEVEEVAAAAFNDLKEIIDNIPSVEVDAELSDNSENAVQNKAVTNELNTKVDKVEGKQLSTEDFTTPLKEKLEGLSPFDPTEINNAIEGLQDSFDALVSGNTSAAIESFNEFVAFLSGITDTQTLAGIVASLEQMIAAKQDKIDDLDAIRSGAEKGATAIQNVKTINGEEIVGEGNIEINVDTSTLATKEELTNLQNEIIANEEVQASALNDLEDRKADKTYVEDALGNIDFSTLATKEEVQNLTNEMIANEEVHAAAYNDLNERLNNGGGSSGGSGVVTFYIPSGETVTDEEIAKNKAAYEAYVESYTNPPIVRLSYLDVPMHLYAAMSSYDIESNKVVVGIIHQADVIRQTGYMIGADGSVMIQS